MTASISPATQAAYEHNGRPVSREAFYAIACDPARSVAVEACAGAGKTWMLVSRMLRALLAGAQLGETEDAGKCGEHERGPVSSGKGADHSAPTVARPARKVLLNYRAAWVLAS